MAVDIWTVVRLLSFCYLESCLLVARTYKLVISAQQLVTCRRMSKNYILICTHKTRIKAPKTHQYVKIILAWLFVHGMGILPFSMYFVLPDM